MLGTSIKVDIRTELSKKFTIIIQIEVSRLDELEKVVKRKSGNSVKYTTMQSRSYFL